MIVVMVLSAALYYSSVVWFAWRYWRMVQGLVPTRSEQFPAFWRLAARDTALLAAVPLPLVGVALWLHV